MAVAWDRPPDKHWEQMAHPEEDADTRLPLQDPRGFPGRDEQALCEAL